MTGTDHTRASSNGGSDGGKPLKAVLTIERRMGQPVENEQINLLFGSQMLIGRDESCDIIIDDDRISRKHALVRMERDSVRLSDLGSTNGTTRDGIPVSEEIIIESGNHICVGKAKTFEAKIVESDQTISSVRLASGTDAYLLIAQEMTIGFSETDDLDLIIYDPRILPKHIRIEYFTGQTFLVFLNPDEPAIVNSSPAKEIELRNNYLIEIGDTLIRFERFD